MMIPTVDIAARVYNHKWKIDPIVRSLIDTDFYKLVMCQSVFRNRPDTVVQFSLINRSKSIRLAELIDEISKSAGQVSEMASRVSTAMISINEITGQTAESSVATASAIGKLNQLARELRQAVADFRLPA